ncbi:hypothetical protein LPJ66_010379 [Kickxella alabastrina]|uniref:Uncharacterized protein n=1 Tax=Kickxella alabastrina TaxID=61397 RepID=A0ACC1I369_9FUNG|nr:hypothetical protein LPJ66_010379 [Kickxella alabastrina]
MPEGELVGAEVTDDSGFEEDSVLPKYRVIDLPLSLRAHAFLQGLSVSDKQRPQDQQQQQQRQRHQQGLGREYEVSNSNNSDGALILYNPQPNSWIGASREGMEKPQPQLQPQLQSQDYSMDID